MKRGRTLGKSLFELEVVDTATGNRPSVAGAALRVALPVAVLLAAALTERALGAFGYKLRGVANALLILVSCTPPVALLWASLRSLGKQTLWDRLSGTMVRYRTRRTTPI
jgi:hypothetical protein